LNELKHPMKIFWIAIIVLLVLMAIGIIFITYVCADDWCFIFPWQKIQAVDSFERCAGLGFPVMESYPRQCRAGNKSFVEVIKPSQPPDNNSTNSGSSGINGYIHMGPICPVESYPPDSGCADRPYASATVVATNAAGKQYQGKTDADGKFRIAVPVGTYTVTTDQKNMYPRCGTQEAIVTIDKFTNVGISCDTGIR